MFGSSSAFFVCFHDTPSANAYNGISFSVNCVTILGNIWRERLAASQGSTHVVWGSAQSIEYKAEHVQLT